MHAELRGMYSPDVLQCDLTAWRPHDGDCFAIAIGAFIGPSEAPLGEELFTFTVCTPIWLASHVSPKGFEFLRGVILVSSWDYSTVERAIRDLCLRTEGDTWDEVTQMLDRYVRWEFDDYRPD
jgi:Immunity protein 8